MRNAIALIIATAMVLALSATAGAQEYARGRILVSTFPDSPSGELDEHVKEHGARVGQRINGTDFRIVTLPPKANERAVANQLRKQKGVRAAQLDYLRPPGLTPNDPQLGSAWHLATLGAASAWDVSQGDGIIMAVCDTGVDPNHPDLNLVLPGWNTYDNTTNSTDVHGHGTKVAGSVAMIGNNGIGGAGVSFRTRILPIRVSDPNGWAYDSSIAACITKAADMGAHGANASYAVCTSPVVEAAAQYMRGKGGVVTISAGNGGSESVTSESSMLTCVGATDSSDNKTSWSSYGIGTDVTAPGDNVFTTFSGGGFGGASGTSFSAPVTLGVYALMMAANPALAPADLDRILFATARDLGAAGRDNLYGWGRINAAAAVITARSEGAPSPDIVAPSVRFEAPASGVTVSGTYVVRVTASDDRAVAGIELWINGRMAATSTSASLSYDWDTCPTNTRGRKRAACGGTSSLKVTAKDAAGNASSATVFVSVVQ